MLHNLAILKTQKSRTECRFVKTGVLRLTTHQIWDQNRPTVNLDAGMGPRYNEPLHNEVLRGTQREYSSKPLKHSIVKRILVFKR